MHSPAGNFPRVFRARGSSSAVGTRRFLLSAAALSAALTLGFSPTPVAAADEVEQLIEAMEETSRVTAAKNEQVKHLQEQIDEQQASISEHRREVERAGSAATFARDSELAQQLEVNHLAGAKYRGAMIDPITNMFAAENPQNAIDRASYLGTLSRQSAEKIDGLSESTSQAAAAHNAAARAQAEADFWAGQLEESLQELNREREELEDQIEAIQARVDELDASSSQRWLTKNGPIEGVSLDGLSGSPEGVAAVEQAMSKLGAPYSWGGVGPDAFDCSGLIFWAYQQQGKSIPRTSQAQMSGGTSVSRAELQPGDVVGYFPGATHVGLYIGDGMIVHASDYGIPVQVVPVDSMPWHGASRF